MEEFERKHINKNLTKLIDETECNITFLAILREKNILGKEDLQQINAQETDIAKSYKLYDKLQTRIGSYNILLHALKETKQTSAASVLDHIVEQTITPSVIEVETIVNKLFEKTYLKMSEEPLSEGIIFDVSSPSHLFTGRFQKLEELHKNICRGGGKSASATFQITCICGLGGIGKTELCRKYIEEYSGDFNDILWINAEKADSLKESFERLAKDYFGIKTKDANEDLKSIKTIVEEIYLKLSMRGKAGMKCLMVFDNAENKEFLYQFIPSRSFHLSTQRPFVILTSRESVWPSGTITLELDKMNKIDAADFVKKGFEADEHHESEEDIRLLLEKLQYFPLAIQQSISYICEMKKKMGSYNVHSYLEEYESNTKVLLDSSFYGLFNDYDKTTFTTWKLTMKTIWEDSKSGNLATKIFQIMGYLDSKRIPIHLFFKLANESEEELSCAVDLLVKYSMAKKDAKLGLLSIHRLVQKVTRIQLQEQNLETEILGNALDLFIKIKINMDNVEHAVSTWNHGSKHPNLQKLCIPLALKIISLYKSQRRFDECQKFAKASLKLFTVSSWEVIKIERALAETCHIQGKYTEAIDLYQGILQKLATIETTNNVELERLSIQHKIGQVLRLQGKYQDAIELLEKVINERRISFSSDNVSICDALHTQITALIFTGNYESALKKSDEVLSCYKLPISDSKKELHFLQDIAIVHGENGDISTAVSMLKETYEKMKDRFGIEDPYTLRCGHNLALYLTKAGENEESLQLFTEILEKKKKVEGHDHPSTFLTIESLAETLINIKECDKALDLLFEVHNNYSSFYGKDNPKTLICRLAIGTALSLQGNCDQALHILNDVLKSLKQSLGEYHPDVLKTKLEIALVLRRNGEYENALTILNEVLILAENHKSVHESHPVLQKTRETIARIKEILEICQK